MYREKGEITMLYILIVLLVLEWVLISQPIVEVGSAWLGMTKAFTIFELQGEGSLKAIVIVLHIAAIAALLVPVVMKRESKRIYFIPAIVTSLLAIFMYMQVAMKLDSLITDTALGELIQFVSVDVALTATATCMLISAIAICAISVVLILRSGAAGNKPEENAEQEKPAKAAWDGRLFEKGNIREAAAVLLAVCLVVSAGLMIPTVIRSLVSNSIVDSWYVDGAKKGDSPMITFYNDNTCEINGYYGPNQWDIVDGNLVITTGYGEKLTYSYGWDGNDLIINGKTFTRSPNG